MVKIVVYLSDGRILFLLSRNYEDANERLERLRSDLRADEQIVRYEMVDVA